MEKRIVTPEEMEFFLKAEKLLKKYNEDFRDGKKNEPDPISDEDYKRFHNIASRVMNNEIIEGQKEEKRLLEKK